MSTHPSPEQLSAFLDQELPDAVRLSIEEHLGACDACAAHLAELASVDEAVRALPLEEPAGYFDDFASRVRGRIAVRPTRRAVPVWTWAAAAAVLLAVVTPLAWRERAAQSPAPAVMRDQVAPPAAVPVAPESAAKPQAPPAGAGAAGAANADGALQSRGRRANEVAAHDRLQRRDQAAEGAPLPEFQESQDKRELGPEPAGAPATAPPARLEEKARVETRAFGYATPPATSQRPHGPAGQQQLAPPPAAAPAPADREAAATAEVVGTDDELRDADLAKEKDDSVRRQKGAPAFESGARTAAGGAAPEAKLGATIGSVMKAAPSPAATGDEARGRRETFRRMALEHPEGPAADEARVGTIEQGVRAYRLDGRVEDRATAERDGRAYLARPDALQATRVRLLLKELSEPRS